MITISHQTVVCVTTVGGCLSECCSVINLAICWISQIATVDCQDKKYIM